MAQQLESILAKYVRVITAQAGINVVQCDKLTASTDGQTVFVPYLSGAKWEAVQKNLDAKGIDADRLIFGLLDHESGHCTTTFGSKDRCTQVTNALNNKINNLAYKVGPKYPLVTRQATNNLIRFVYTKLWNFVEDRRMENAWCERFPGSADNFAEVSKYDKEILDDHGKSHAGVDKGLATEVFNVLDALFSEMSSPWHAANYAYIIPTPEAKALVNAHLSYAKAIALPNTEAVMDYVDPVVVTLVNDVLKKAQAAAEEAKKQEEAAKKKAEEEKKKAEEAAKKAEEKAKPSEGSGKPSKDGKGSGKDSKEEGSDKPGKGASKPKDKVEPKSKSKPKAEKSDEEVDEPEEDEEGADSDSEDEDEGAEEEKKSKGKKSAEAEDEEGDETDEPGDAASKGKKDEEGDDAEGDSSDGEDIEDGEDAEDDEFDADEYDRDDDAEEEGEEDEKPSGGTSGSGEATGTRGTGTSDPKANGGDPSEANSIPDEATGKQNTGDSGSTKPQSCKPEDFESLTQEFTNKTPQENVLDKIAEIIRKTEKTIATDPNVDPLKAWEPETTEDDCFDPVKAKVDAVRLNAFEAAVSKVSLGPVGRKLLGEFRSRFIAAEEGPRLNSRSLARLAVEMPELNTLFLKKTAKKARKNLAVQIVVDCSGSMRGKKMELSMQAAAAMADLLHRLAIPFEVVGFTTGVKTSEYGHKSLSSYRPYTAAPRRVISHPWTRSEALYFPVFKSFNDTLDTARNNMAEGQYFAGNNNVDGESLLLCANRLLARRETRKIMIVLSDGAPAFHQSGSRGWGFDTGSRHLKAVCRKLETIPNLELYGIGVLDEAVKRYYRRWVCIQNLSELPVALGKLLAGDDLAFKRHVKEVKIA